MWKCHKCSELITDSFDSCWKCGTHKNGASASVEFTNTVNCEFTRFNILHDDEKDKKKFFSRNWIIFSFSPSFCIISILGLAQCGFLDFINKYMGIGFLTTSILAIYFLCYYFCFNCKSCLWVLISVLLNVIISFIAFAHILDIGDIH